MRKKEEKDVWQDSGQAQRQEPEISLVSSSGYKVALSLLWDSPHPLLPLPAAFLLTLLLFAV